MSFEASSVDFIVSIYPYPTSIDVPIFSSFLDEINGG
jgi:hypothetical protein